MSQGFRMAGDFSVAFAVELDKDIAFAYQKNHPETDVYPCDIRDINIKELHTKHPIIDVIIGGPPCQGFSQKGKRLSLDDPRNFLFQQYVRFVEEFRPKYFVLENVPGIITTSNGYFKDEKAVIEKINAAKPDVLFVCLGAPKQEKFIKTHFEELDVTLMLGLGGSLDGYAGVAQRAPKWMIDMSLEWLYRLLKEPKRLGRMMRLPKFVLACGGEKLRRKKSG